jgi:hypothetical protein
MCHHHVERGNVPTRVMALSVWALGHDGRSLRRHGQRGFRPVLHCRQSLLHCLLAHLCACAHPARPAITTIKQREETSRPIRTNSAIIEQKLKSISKNSASHSCNACKSLTAYIPHHSYGTCSTSMTENKLQTLVLKYSNP